jgi:hypothetical protein
MRLLALSTLVASVQLVTGRITGFHVDDESCSGLIMNNKTDQKIKCAVYFNSLANLSAALAHYSSDLKGPSLTLTVDAGTAWSCPGGQVGCFNLTFNGTTKSVAEHVVDLSDGVVLMDYNRNASNVLQRAAPYLAYADSVGGAVSVGLSIAGSPESAASWQTRSEQELAGLMANSMPALATHRSFTGFSVFIGQTWQTNSGPVGDALAWPDNTGIWYVDHKLVLNETRRAQWLAWAKSRHIGVVYIAPHAGSTALISIPGKEGSVSNDIKFCDFIHQAEEEGIDVQLLSDPEVDINFIRNCSARAQ